MNLDVTAKEQQTKIDFKILHFEFPDGQQPDWHISPGRILARIPGFEQRYQSTKRILNPGGLDCDVLQEIQDFARDFFAAWETSSPMVLKVCGTSQAMAMLELFTACRELIWDFEYVTLFEELPDRLKIFRGGAGSTEEVLKGFSWSLSQEVAEQFAARSANGLVLKAELAKEDVLLVSSLEWEVVPRSGALSNVVQIR